MAKAPGAGSVKTRLRPFLTGEQCASLATCFLKDAVSNAVKAVPNVIVALSPADGRAEIESLLGREIALVEQKGNDLGERLASAVMHAERLGFSPIIAIGTDSPTLPPSFLTNTIESFRESDTDIVLGGTRDGGYYLIGLRKMTPGIFDGVSWSSEHVYRETLENAKRIGLSNRVDLPIWHDVDVPAVLVAL
ncbi:TIGR04282 family arsenosugar biosynthesis glycosyltransferase [soil metagenome]